MRQQSAQYEKRGKRITYHTSHVIALVTDTIFLNSPCKSLRKANPIAVKLNLLCLHRSLPAPWFLKILIHACSGCVWTEARYSVTGVALCNTGVRRNFSRGATSTFCWCLSGCWRCNANVRSRKVLPFLHNNTTKNAHVTTIATKLRIVGSHSQVYYDNFHNRLSADIQGRVLLFTEVLPRSLTKPQITTVFS